jgi:acetyl esterase/lipase
MAAFLRLFLRATFRPFIGPRLGAPAQRRWAWALSLLMPGRLGLRAGRERVGAIDVRVLAPAGKAGPGVVLYLHGGAFCLGSAFTHRGMCSHLAHASGMPVWIPNYRLAPEHPYPCALQDALAAFDALLQKGYASGQIVLAGDSAGATLALALAIHLRRQGRSMPAGLALISPVTDFQARRTGTAPGVRGDPMVTQAWLEQGVQWLRVPPGAPEFTPLTTDLRGLPPMLVQAGQEEILLPDSLRLAAHALACHVPCQMEVHAQRWHVFHLQAFYLRSARLALHTLGRFAQACVTPPAPTNVS